MKEVATKSKDEDFRMLNKPQISIALDCQRSKMIC